MPGQVTDVHLHTPGHTRTLCDLITATTQWAESAENATCPVCLALTKPPTDYRRTDIRVGGETGAYVTVYQRVGETPLLDLNFFDGDRSMDEAVLRAKALMTAWEIAAAWHVETRSTTGHSAAL
jgi:hypothetical protein